VRRVEVAGVNIQVPSSCNVVGLVLSWSSETLLRGAMVDLKAVDEDIASALAAVVLTEYWNPVDHLKLVSGVLFNFVVVDLKEVDLLSQ